MQLKQFMIPANDVIVFSPNSSIKEVVAALQEKRIGSAVLVEGKKAVGIITKTDLMKAYAAGTPLSAPAKDIASTNLKTLDGEKQRDEVAEFLVDNKLHHVIVVDNNGEFIGETSVYDVAREIVLDGKAFPWNRGALNGYL